MLQTSEATSDASEQGNDYKPFSRWWAVPGIALAAVVAALVDQFGPFAMGEAAGLCTVPTAAVLASCWRHYRHERWARSFAVTVVLLHVIGIALIPWPTKHDFSKSDLLFVWADLFANYGLMALFQWVEVISDFSRTRADVRFPPKSDIGLPSLEGRGGCGGGVGETLRKATDCRFPPIADISSCRILVACKFALSSTKRILDPHQMLCG